ncbi:MAG: hypothetical protein P8R38_04345, partial [Planctomycetota bacterium]|nr:hypothetical protein [Planctomycetota bacterium]
MSTIEDKNHSKSHHRVSQNRSGGGLARHLVLKTLSSIKLGLLHIVDGPDTHTFGSASEDSLEATICITDSRFYRNTLL